MNDEQRIARYLDTVVNNKYVRVKPTDRQLTFLMQDHIPEVLYGGAAGGGKSEALLIAALQYVSVAGYAAMLFRRTYSDLALPNAIMDRAENWLIGTDAHWDDKNKTWTFPSGATLSFGYLDGPRDHYRYQGSEFQFVGFDEVTQFREPQYLYLHSRLRRLANSDIPIRMRAASNPGDIGHEWVFNRFINAATCRDRVFIPARLSDNPHLDKDAYIQSLNNLDPITREQLLNGNWNVRPEGGLFKREWMRLVDSAPKGMPLCRYWDKAATEGGGDWTAGVLLGIDKGIVYIVNVVRTQSRPAGVQAIIAQTAQLDGPEVMIRMEQEPGSSGVDVIDHYAREVLTGYNFKGVKSTGSKIDRAAALSTAAENGNMRILNAPWTAAFIEELVLFPTEGVHDDQVDAASGAHNALALRPMNKIRAFSR